MVITSAGRPLKAHIVFRFGDFRVYDVFGFEKAMESTERADS